MTIVGLVSLSACVDGGDEDRQAGPTLPPSIEELFPEPAVVEEDASGGWLEMSCSAPLEHLLRVKRGTYPGRSYDLVFIPRYPNSIGEFDYTTHGGPWDYIQRVPLVFSGPGYFRAQGEVDLGRETSVADIAPTLASIMGAREPNDGPGSSLEELVLPRERRSGPPKLIVTVVWDGGGTDVLQAWPDAWPNLAELISNGSMVEDAIVGSAPSTTPPVHATIGTGVWPSEHGIVDLTQRRGDYVVDSYLGKDEGFDPVQLEAPTLADMHDLATENRARIGLIGHRGWHLGMMGHGARSEGGDRDIAALIDRRSGEVRTSAEWYELPGYLRSVPGLEEDTRTADAADGEIDGRWRRVDLEDPVTHQYSPAFTLYQTRLLEEMIEREKMGDDAITDMVFVNYKQIDDVGHFYNMLSPEMEEIVRFTDDALGELVGLLNKGVGRDEWAIVMTADHGETPDLRALGGWPIDLQAIQARVAAHFDVAVEDLFVQERTMGYWFDDDFRRAEGISLDEIADFVAGLSAREAFQAGEESAADYRAGIDAPAFEAVFPGDRIDRVIDCARESES